MHIKKVEIKNFRLLSDVELILEKTSTVIVGRNNSGKTSLTELFRRLLGENVPTFRLEDFSLSAHEMFWSAFRQKTAKSTIKDMRELLPYIEAKITVDYSDAGANLGALGGFIIDLDPASFSATILFRYQLKDGAIGQFFDSLPTFDAARPEGTQKNEFLKAIRDRVPKTYVTSVTAIDVSDPSNTKSMEWNSVKALFAGGFITAQRGLDDITHKDSDVLGKVLERLLDNAMSESAGEKDREVAEKLQDAVKDIQLGIDKGFNLQLQELLPAFSLFGYPGFADPRLRTETTLDVQRLLTNHTRVHYAGVNGINLPEAYNGLGSRNLIFILLKLLEFFKQFAAEKIAPGIHLIFIEEPEVHLHPQMQEVFIDSLSKIAAEFSNTYGGGLAWPVQFIVTTHSSHVANKASFDSMRYFLAKFGPAPDHFRSSQIKDLRIGLGATPASNREFLHKYMTLTRCDLLFADKAILIEGTSERLLLPKMIEKIDSVSNPGAKLSTQYVTALEVGGAYAHLFFDLMDFLEIPTLVITDLDSTKKKGAQHIACKVSEGVRTSNACIKSWLDSPDITPAALILKPDIEKTCKLRRIAYQIPESANSPCGRSFEAAFILGNIGKFGLSVADEDAAWDKAQEMGKSDFALKYAIEETDWTTPRYIAEGLVWLRQMSRSNENPPAQPCA